MTLAVEMIKSLGNTEYKGRTNSCRLCSDLCAMRVHVHKYTTYKISKKLTNKTPISLDPHIILSGQSTREYYTEGKLMSLTLSQY